MITAAASAAALAVGVGSALAQTARHQKPGGTCHYTFAQSGRRSLSGTVSCSRPAGKGTAKSKYTTLSGPHKLHVAGTFTDKFKQGTISGSYKLTGPESGPNFHGTFKITNASGKLKPAHGSGTMDCTEGMNALRCTQTLTKGSL